MQAKDNEVNIFNGVKSQDPTRTASFSGWMPPREEYSGPDPYRWELILCTPHVIFYALARTYLVVEVFVGLRQLPVSAYDTVNWSTFIPRL